MTSSAKLAFGLACALPLVFAPHALAQTPLYQNPSAPFDTRVSDLLSRMTLEEKISQLMNDSPAIPRLGVPAYNWWNECLHGVARAGRATVFPRDHRPRRHLGHGPHLPRRHRHLRRSPRQEQRIRPPRQAQHLSGPHLLDAQHQPLPRSALGPRHGDLRRRSVPHRRAWPCSSSRACRATTRSTSRPSPPPSITPYTADPNPSATLSTPSIDERDLRDTYLPHFEAAIKEGGAYSVMCAYNSVDGAPACANPRSARRDPAQAVGLPGLRGFRLRRHRRYLPASQVRAHRRSWASPKPSRPEPISTAAWNTKPAARREAGPYRRSRDRSSRCAACCTARFRLGMFDPPAMVKYAQIPLQRERQPGASPARARSRAQIHRAAEERKPRAAARANRSRPSP